MKNAAETAESSGGGDHLPTTAFSERGKKMGERAVSEGGGGEGETDHNNSRTERTTQETDRTSLRRE